MSTLWLISWVAPLHNTVYKQIIMTWRRTRNYCWEQCTRSLPVDTRIDLDSDAVFAILVSRNGVNGLIDAAEVASSILVYHNVGGGRHYSLPVQVLLHPREVLWQVWLDCVVSSYYSWITAAPEFMSRSRSCFLPPLHLGSHSVHPALKFRYNCCSLSISA